MIFEYLKLRGWQHAKTEYYGHTRAWSQIGSAVSTVVVTAIIWFRSDYNIVFLFTLVPYCLGFALLASYPKKLEGKIATKLPLSKLPGEIKNTLMNTFSAFRSPVKLKLSLGVASFTGFYFAVKDYLQLVIIAMVAITPWFSELGWENNKKEKLVLGTVYTGLYFLTAAASRKTQSLNARFKNVSAYLNFLLLAGILTGIIAGFAFKREFLIPALIMFLLIYTIQNLRKPAGTALIADNFDNKILASALSIESQLSSVIGALLGLILGFLADSRTPGNSIILVSALMLILFPLIKIKPHKTTN